ncbi:MAG: aldo/keto reductase [Anaerolineales bacterium]|nr:aldo/keto reductase [Anaerolineales bacterium]
MSSRVLFGAFAVGFMEQAEADKVLDVLLKYNINHIDTAPTYGDSELRVGEWMKRYRQQFFLATKTGERDYKSAYSEIQRSLDRLQTNTIDLLQFHNLVDPADWEEALHGDGALEAAVEARSKGYIRYIGVTGHGMSVARRHLASLEEFPFDSVLLPYNIAFMEDGRYKMEFEQLYDYCQKNQVAVQTIKSIARGRWGDKPKQYLTWYEPLDDQKEIDRAVAYVLKRPGVFLNSAGDPTLLPKVLEAARRFSVEQPLEDTEEVLEKIGIQPLFPEGDEI